MNELFETVIILSLLGFGITALLLLLKPITVKRFPAKWQYYVWVVVMLSMIIPVYKFIPRQEAQRLNFVLRDDRVQNIEIQQTEASAADIPKSSIAVKQTSISLEDVLPYLWITGMCGYAIFVAGCYITFIVKKRKNSFVIEGNQLFCDTKRELKIKRKIKLKIADDIGSPMLVGLFKPTIYIPAKSIDDENMRMIFLHELTHYKRGDLLIKWLSLFVNAVHWFNPLAYILCANISEACEISCDMEVTQNMTDEGQKLYMRTILDLAE